MLSKRKGKISASLLNDEKSIVVRVCISITLRRSIPWHHVLPVLTDWKWAIA